MNPCRVLIGLLLTAIVTVDLALLPRIWDGQARWPDAFSITVLGLILGQLTLLCAWFVFGRSNLVWKTILLVAAQLLAGQFAARCAQGNPGSWSLALAVYLALAIAGMMMLRAAKFEIQTPDRRTDSASLSWNQWSIFQLFSVTTAIAILLAYWTQRPIDWAIVARAVLFFGFLALVSVATTWSGFRQRMATVGALSAMTILVAAVWFRWLDVRGIDQAAMVFLVLVQQAFLYAAAIVFRVSGMKLVRRSIVVAE